MTTTKTALVTGANQGIGLETCRQLLAEGYDVILTSRNAASGQEEARRLGVAYRQLDVADPSSVKALADGLARDGVKLDVLVNNAGISMDGFNDTVVRGTLGTNFYGAMAVTDALLPLMRDGGTIVNVSSGMGELHVYSAPIRARFADPKLTRAELLALVREFIDHVAAGDHEKHGWPSSAYRVSKAALNAFTRILARELPPRRIRVNAVCPGWVRTRMGGRSASRPVEKGAASVMWAAVLDDDTTGGFWRDGKPANW